MSALTSRYWLGLLGALGSDPSGEVDAVADILVDAWRRDATVFTLGNGASAALAAHMACDLGKGSAVDLGEGAAPVRRRRLRVISIADDTALLTALGNDVDYEHVFVEQLKNLARPGDVVVAISGSGGSPNVLRAVEYARSLGCRTVAMTGQMAAAPELTGRCDVALVARSAMIEQVEDVHVALSHMLAIEVRERLKAERP